jgi:mannosyltransferase OCH1-like enzyme
MIPKIIHFCWFGENEKSALIKACIESWTIYLPDWEVMEWNEKNSPIDHPFVKKALSEKKYVFAADFVRFYALKMYGGVYLDTDMEIIKDLTPLLNYDFFAAYEDSDLNKISCGAIGSIKDHEILNKIFEYYNHNTQFYVAVPQILGQIYNDEFENVKILPIHSFYPYNPFDENKLIKQLMYSSIKEDTYGIHHWEYSWKFSFLERVINKIKKIFLK